jgi:endonuclease G
MSRKDDVVAYVRGILVRDGVTADGLAASRMAAGPGLESVGLSTDLQERHLEMLRRIERGQPISDGDLLQLEAIVIPNGLRPSFDVVNDSFADLPAPWSETNAHRPALERLIRGIGRVDLDGHPGRPIAGTAFVVAPDLLMTNRHVAEFFVDGLGAAPSLTFKPGMSASLDLRQELGSTASIRLRVTAPVLVLDTWDAALLRVDALPAGVTPIPLAGAPPAALESRLAMVVGYPSFDVRADVAQQLMLFRSVFDKKRLMPGRLMGRRTTNSFGRDVLSVAHDCTTLGGNSGSAVIDVETTMVLGVHFKGDAGIANYAVPSWELATDPRVTGAGVPFV